MSKRKVLVIVDEGADGDLAPNSLSVEGPFTLKENGYQWRSAVKPVHEAITALCESLRNELIACAKEDPRYKEYGEVCLEIIKDKLPELAMAASQRWFAGHMRGILDAIGSIETSQFNTANLVEELEHRMNGLGQI